MPLALVGENTHNNMFWRNNTPKANGRSMSKNKTMNLQKIENIILEGLIDLRYSTAIFIHNGLSR